MQSKEIAAAVDLQETLHTLPTDDYDEPLVCSGCAHSAAGAPFPGRPSGERPCCFCVRNPEREEWNKQAIAEGHPPLPQVWYDGSVPVKVPMDCYHSVDMKRQYETWGTVKQRDP